MAAEQDSGSPLHSHRRQNLPGEPRPWEQPPRPRSYWLYYAYAGSLTVGALLTDLALLAPSKDQPTAIVFLIPVALSAYLGGLGPGLWRQYWGWWNTHILWPHLRGASV